MITDGCEACGCGIGKGYEQQGRKFREHVLCEPCCTNWKVLDRYLAREATWEEYLDGVSMRSKERIFF